MEFRRGDAGVRGVEFDPDEIASLSKDSCSVKLCRMMGGKFFFDADWVYERVHGTEENSEADHTEVVVVPGNGDDSKSKKEDTAGADPVSDTAPGQTPKTSDMHGNRILTTGETLEKNSASEPAGCLGNLIATEEDNDYCVVGSDVMDQGGRCGSSGDWSMNNGSSTALLQPITSDRSQFIERERNVEPRDKRVSGVTTVAPENWNGCDRAGSSHRKDGDTEGHTNGPRTVNLDACREMSGNRETRGSTSEMDSTERLLDDKEGSTHLTE